MSKKLKPSLEKVVEELQRRKAPPKLVLEDYLFDKQLKFVQDESPYKIAVTSRRSGKSVSCAVDLLYTSLNCPECVCLYITLSRNNAKKIIWPELKRLVKKFELKAKFNESDLSVEFNNGSMIYASGASDKAEIEKFRGLSLKKVYIDECQSFPSYIESLIDDVLAPALMDHAGSLSLIGTPGPIPAGFFFDCSRSLNWASHSWTFWDNPHIAYKSNTTHKALLERELKRRGVDKNNPSIQREWYGHWVLDTDSLVFKYDLRKNHYETTPKLNNFVMGIDIGYDDADAICVLGWNDQEKITYLLEEETHRHQGITELVSQIERLRKTYDISKIVMDTAGLGKKISEEISKRYQITINPAEKPRKLEFIELMNDALRKGQLRARKDGLFATDCMKVEWDLDKSTPDKMRVSDRYHSDITDAVLYAWRLSYAYTSERDVQKPLSGTAEWYKAEIEAMEQAAEEHFKALEEAEKHQF